MRDLKTEQNLKLEGVAFSYVTNFVLSLLSKAQTSLYNVRLGPNIDETNVAAMRATVDAGGQLPAIIVAPNGKTGYVKVDGHHRVHLYQALKAETCDAYVLQDVSDDQVKLLQRLVNVWSGKDTIENRTELAACAVIESGITRDVAAKKWGVSESSIANRIRAMEVRRTLAASGHEFNRYPLSDTQLCAMHRIHKRAGALVPAAKLTSKAQLNHQEVADVVKNFEVAPDDKAVSIAESKYLKLYDSRIKQKLKGKRVASVGVLGAIQRSIATLSNQIAVKGTLAQLKKRLTPSEKRALSERVSSLKTAISELEKAIGTVA